MVLNFLRILYTYRQEFDGIMHNKPAWPNQILEYRRKKKKKVLQLFFHFYRVNWSFFVSQNILECPQEKYKFYKMVAGFLIYWQLLVWVFTKIFSYRTVY